MRRAMANGRAATHGMRAHTFQNRSTANPGLRNVPACRILLLAGIGERAEQCFLHERTRTFSDQAFKAPAKNRCSACRRSLPRTPSRPLGRSGSARHCGFFEVLCLRSFLHCGHVVELCADEEVETPACATRTPSRHNRPRDATGTAEGSFATISNVFRFNRWPGAAPGPRRLGRAGAQMHARRRPWILDPSAAGICTSLQQALAVRAYK